MSHIQTLIDVLTDYHTLPHHQNHVLKHSLKQIQTWQKKRIKTANASLFDNPKTAPLAQYLIDRIYGDDDFDVLANQLLTAGNNALNGSGRLEKLVPTNVLTTGILAVKSAVLAIKLDLNLAQILINNPLLLATYQEHGLNDALMMQLYRLANAQSQRIAQIHEIAQVCQSCDKYFNSFIIQKTFGLAKNTAYENGYQVLYDFIGDGLNAMKNIKKINDFTEPFVATELHIINNIHQKGMIYD